MEHRGGWRLTPCARSRGCEGLLRLAWAQQMERHTRSGGRGRGSVTRAQRGHETIRSHITRLERQACPIAARQARLGWKALVTNATQARRSWGDAAWC